MLSFPYFVLPAFSSPAFSTLAGIFHLCSMVPHFLVLHFPPLQNGAAFSSPAFSTLAVWCRVFQCRVFHPSHGARFPSRVFRSRIFSAPISVISVPKKFCKQTILVRLTVTNIVTFFWDTVYINTELQTHQ